MRFLLRAVSLLFVGGHFVLTLLYVAPTNPVKAELQPLIRSTIGTYFPQNWRLFAPDPIQNSYSLLVHPLRSDDLPNVEAPVDHEDLENSKISEMLPEKGWYDLSKPAWDAFQRDRFAAGYDRLSRPQWNAILIYLRGGTGLSPWRRACRLGDSISCKFLFSRLEQDRRHARSMLVDIASAFCKDIHVASECDRVALRIREIRAVPWSERWEGQPEVVDYDVGVFEVNERVASPGLYRVP